MVLSHIKFVTHWLCPVEFVTHWLCPVEFVTHWLCSVEFVTHWLCSVEIVTNSAVKYSWVDEWKWKENKKRTLVIDWCYFCTLSSLLIHICIEFVDHSQRLVLYAQSESKWKENKEISRYKHSLLSIRVIIKIIIIVIAKISHTLHTALTRLSHTLHTPAQTGCGSILPRRQGLLERATAAASGAHHCTSMKVSRTLCIYMTEWRILYTHKWVTNSAYIWALLSIRGLLERATAAASGAHHCIRMNESRTLCMDEWVTNYICPAT